MSIYVTQFQEDNFLDPIFKADMILKKKTQKQQQQQQTCLTLLQHHTVQYNFLQKMSILCTAT